MKIVINGCYGGFSVSEDFVKKHNVDRRNETKLRTFKPLIDAIEKGEYVDAPFSNLRVVDIPDEATDYLINEYDGVESILCVLDGKIVEL